MSKIANSVEKIIFASRWLLSPLYLGLVLVLMLIIVRFVIDLISLVSKIGEAGGHEFVTDLLAILDLVLLSNLILIVIFAGYENFVSRIDVAHDSVDRPHWMGTIDFSGLKIKLIGSLVAISVIELLKDFIHLGETPNEPVGPALIWRIVIHLVFVVSGVLFALMDTLSDKHKSEAKLITKK